MGNPNEITTLKSDFLCIVTMHTQHHSDYPPQNSRVYDQYKSRQV